MTSIRDAPGKVQNMRKGVETGGRLFPVLRLISPSLVASLLMLVCFHHITLLPYEKQKAYWTHL